MNRHQVWVYIASFPDPNNKQGGRDMQLHLPNWTPMLLNQMPARTESHQELIFVPNSPNTLCHRLPGPSDNLFGILSRTSTPYCLIQHMNGLFATVPFDLEEAERLPFASSSEHIGGGTAPGLPFRTLASLVSWARLCSSSSPHSVKSLSRKAVRLSSS